MAVRRHCSRGLVKIVVSVFTDVVVQSCCRVAVDAVVAVMLMLMCMWCGELAGRCGGIVKTCIRCAATC